MWKKKHIFYFFIRMRDDDVGVEDIFMRDEESRLILFLDVHVFSNLLLWLACISLSQHMLMKIVVGASWEFWC